MMLEIETLNPNWSQKSLRRIIDKEKICVEFAGFVLEIEKDMTPRLIKKPYTGHKVINLRSPSRMKRLYNILEESRT